MEKLTDTERHIAELAARGHTNHEIGDELRLSSKTVEWNLTKIYRRLGIRSRSELAPKVRGFPREERGSI
jgi:DNA-binding NarL/FixJ family response regulator